MERVSTFCGLLVIVVSICVQSVTCQNCHDLDLELMTEFDTERFLGKWYQHRFHWTLNISLLNDFTSYAVETAGGNITKYFVGRAPDKPDDQCHLLAVRTLVPTDTPGHFLSKAPSGASSLYYVLDTDYTSYAVDYMCFDFAQGTCGRVESSVWSRTPTLPQEVRDRLDELFPKACLTAPNYTEIVQRKECNVPNYYAHTPGQDCQVDDIQIQEDFDIDRYSGLWFETRWLSRRAVPLSERYHDYLHIYNVTTDGNITIYSQGRDQENKCFYIDIDMLASGTPGKFVYKDSLRPYWVLRTDYVQYAVAYGCYNVSVNGTCSGARGWVWSRTPQLSQRLQNEANYVLQRACVVPAALLDIKQDNRCPPDPRFSPVNSGLSSVVNLLLLAVMVVWRAAL